MTVLSRGARVRRGGRRPGWLLLTALLVLAIGASSALVFTDRVELLKLAVILALWAAVVAAFVSVIYRRQSDADQARARDLKLVYDLQLDREISARREYELTVESQLRRELASELRAQAADEVAALRAELAALRTNLEILFDAELAQRPALESERGYSDWQPENERQRDRVHRVGSVRAEDAVTRTEESAIIDVPEEPLVPSAQDGYAYPAGESFRGAGAYESAEAYADPDRRQHSGSGRIQPDQPPSRARWASAHQRQARPDYQEPSAPPEPERPTLGDQRQPPAPGSDWQPVSDEGQWLPPGSPGSNWVSNPPANNGMTADSLSEPRLAAPPPVELRGRHSAAAESLAGDHGGWQDGETGPGRREESRRGREGARSREPDVPPQSAGGSAEQAGARHSAEPAVALRPEPVMAPPPEPAARHRSADSPEEPDSPRSGGQSVADLLARLQASPAGGGRRRRREE